jgi:hypothetical protein
MKCFKVVEKVLHDCYAAVPDSAPTRDAAINAAMSATSTQYTTKLVKQGGPDFSSAATRFGYVLKYVPAHAHWVYELIMWSPEAQALFKRNKLRMVSIGGGPGSDLVGVLKYMEETGDCPALHCEIIDGCIDWKSTWSDLAFSLDWVKPLHTDYVIHDAGDPATWAAPSSIDKGDLVVLNFFASEIFHLDPTSAKYLTTMLRRMKAGAILLLNDNNAPQFYNWFDGIAKGVGLTTLVSRAGTRKIYDVGEQTSDLGKYAKKFAHGPKLTGEVASRIMRKS